MKKPFPLAALAALILVQACFTVPVTTTVVTQPGRRVTAKATKFNVLWVSPSPPETASLLIEDLLDQCDGADLTGVTLTTQVGWVVVGQQETTMATGYCVEAGG